MSAKPKQLKRIVEGAGWTFFVLVSLLPPVTGQTTKAGQNAVYGTASTPVATPAFVDASQFSTGRDICSALNHIMQTVYAPANGIVIDARGFPATSGTYPCSSNPWNLVGPALANVVFLPAGKISIQTTWILAQGSRVIGQGPNATLIQAVSGFTGDMIDMGADNSVQSSNPPCSSNGGRRSIRLQRN